MTDAERGAEGDGASNAGQARPEVRGQILAAAAQEIRNASVGDFLAFLTPARLSDSARDPARTWSPATVRYQFRRDGLAFDRAAVAAELAPIVVAELTVAIASWEAWCEETIAAAAIEELPLIVTEAFAALPRLADEATGGAARRVLVLVTLLTLEPATAEQASELLARLAAAGHRLAFACAERIGYADLGDTRLRALGAAAVVRATLMVLTHGSAALPEELETISRGLWSAIGALTGETRPPDPVPVHETADETVVRLGAVLDAVQPETARALDALERYVAVLAASSWAFARGHARLERLRQQPGLRDTERGRRVWRIAAEVLSMADGDRELADEVAAAILDQDVELGPAAARTGWLLLRLERFEEAEQYLRRARRAAQHRGDQEGFALAQAFLAHGACLTGPLERAVTIAEELYRLDGGPNVSLAIAIAAAAASRALLLAGRTAEAAAQLERLAEARGADASLGDTMAQISEAWLSLAGDRPEAALRTLNEVRERLRRIHVANPAGWPWLEPTVVALGLLGRHADAGRLVTSARAPVERWATPTVLAELEHARAVLCPTVSRAEQSIHVAIAALNASGAHVERVRSELILAGLRGWPPAAEEPPMTVSPDSVLVRAVLAIPRAPDGLTPRAHAVAAMVARGMRNQQIAAALGISVSTVGRHVSRAMAATRTRSRTELAILAAGWPPPAGRPGAEE
ncbi:MAG TPA: LuxR C-terminal-related transcriptional regulator [Solirubrobacteraceae bacterium]|nr:LuxR C-terminal-related transcriptional regulator [Solirubrobacteraceae bacterium]